MTEPKALAILVATQNLNAVLRVMQWGVIALIFLFFLRVIRAVWVEMSPATIRKSRSERRQEKRQVRAAGSPARPPEGESTPPALPARWWSRPRTPVAPTTSTTS